ncbi:sulfite exporter TauE/SafE family protein [Marilutibacter alkalisoli]|uniref:Sulfite exporter TauE/SafE family protein n=1 Tax=Marilutibacter alkalisoli TaxID=2591633 RepID=A0A514BS38_9GAMM|nr:sulfite exporter TauE/SafE family protein [Lysobacter alkalisoli]QDH69839.1 sulfite exporter TauE/SafE family protein [Lysobacter alkalisoli]
MPIDWLTLGAALLTGLLGGVHCAAMCGGIATGFSAMALPAGAGQGRRTWVSWQTALDSNLGRVAGYVLAGAIAGGVGRGIVQAVHMEGLATGLRMLVGAVLVLVALRLLDQSGRLAFLGRGGQRFWQLLRPLQRHLLPADTRARRLGLGMLWGWLPCGLSTTLLVAAWLQADAVNGALTMAAFGLGTLPVMLPLTWSGVRLGKRLQDPRWRRIAAGLVLMAGVLTLAAPWLVRVPALHALLSVLGCGSLPG